MICNATDRLNIIEKDHRVELNTKKIEIFHWELNDSHKASAVNDNQVSHIYLLGDDAFKNKAPHHLVNEKLDYMGEDLSIKNAKRNLHEIKAPPIRKFFDDKFIYFC